MTSALEGSEWSASCPGRFTSVERACGSHWVGGWVGPRAGMVLRNKKFVRDVYWKPNGHRSVGRPRLRSHMKYRETHFKGTDLFRTGFNAGFCTTQ